ncbi:MAG: type II toxin-antitoxin system RelE/ParE family toxin [Zoogloeaceae bacterium]|jgi:hypothetical protein|nr:type II toxin-antitoxin system RelE/ParE family toxin [Zoogloeaceae bacterium]
MTQSANRPIENTPDNYRELVVDFGHSGYAARYRVEIEHDTVTVLSVRHQKEAGFKLS